ncbi:hypothetical protein V9L05_17585 [Bernardetia sp. Wsw4-3y2]|uniref:hypothetical protein n=1 Tax=unclassified Bernardetia TaxID=2647129 RepID=UPI0030CC927C
MRIFTKVLLLFFIGILFSLYSCSISYGTCEPTTNSPVAIVDVLEVKHIARNSEAPFDKELMDSIRIETTKYKGFTIKFQTRKIAYYQNRNKSFSLFSYGYALDCSESTLYLREVYPKSIKIYTVYDLHRDTEAGSLVNSYFDLPFRTQDEDKTEFVQSEVTRERFIDNNFPLELEFNIKFTLQKWYRGVKFRIELELSNGEIINAETPTVII